MWMWLEPGTRGPEEAEDEKRRGVLLEVTCGHREESAPFTQLCLSFSHVLLGLEEISKMIWSDLFHCNDEEAAQRD